MQKIVREHINESVTIKTNDKLKSLYNKFNTKYFNNVLPDIPVIFFNSKFKGGTAAAKQLHGNITKILDIKISKYLNSDDIIENVLLHEMVHIHMFTKNIVRDIGGEHGMYFKLDIKRLKTEFNLNVSISIESINLDLVGEKPKKFDVFIKYYDNNRISIIVFKDGGISAERKQFHDRFDPEYEYIKKQYPNAKYIGISSDDPMLLHLSVVRQVKTIKSAVLIKKEEADRIIANGTKIFDVNENKRNI